MHGSSLVTTETLDGVTVVTLSPKCANLSESVIQPVSDAFVALGAVDPPKVVVNLKHVAFFSSSFIEVLFRLWNSVKDKPSGGFGLSNINDDCREILDITNLSRVWNIYDDEAEAVAALSKA